MAWALRGAVAGARSARLRVGALRAAQHAQPAREERRVPGQLPRDAVDAQHVVGVAHHVRVPAPHESGSGGEQRTSQSAGGTAARLRLVSSAASQSSGGSGGRAAAAAAAPCARRARAARLRGGGTRRVRHSSAVAGFHSTTRRSSSGRVSAVRWSIASSVSMRRESSPPRSSSSTSEGAVKSCTEKPKTCHTQARAAWEARREKRASRWGRAIWCGGRTASSLCPTPAACCMDKGK